ncbi:fatty acyl-AMP ligase [Streptomyces filamentosus]|uniref:fatty acyl-AMP ligase n=1 Tax=Streptomyces filamentosus TaxID=67294 RepID=UPI00123C16E5|nr:fatty acyl-AMP ligase [Streptomyces filamentosus]KAA6211340.1 fatty acyl-AMP ligase [Streptomyces filamentosus]
MSLRRSTAGTLAPRPPAEPPATLVEALADRASGPLADLPFLTALDASGRPVERLSAAGLDARARALAAELRATGAPGDRVVVPAMPGLDFHVGFFACLYAGMVAVPVPPLRPAARPGATVRAGRLEGICRDCSPRAVLVPTPEDAAAAGPAPAPGVAYVPVRRPGRPDAPVPGVPEPSVGPSSTALLQYTSGSTGDPRGVVVSHRNLIANQTAMRDRCEIDSGTTVVNWLPLFHDMGLCTSLVLPLVSDASVVTMEPAAFVRDPRVWLRAIEAEEDVFSAAPDFAYDLCVQRIPERERAAVDLSTWRVAANGSEPVRASTLRRFAEAFRPSFFRPEVFSPGYGLAECTLTVTFGLPLEHTTVRHFDREALAAGRAEPVGRSAAAAELVSSGPPLPGVEVDVVDPEGRRLPAGAVGEIQVRSTGNCGGYWGRPELSAEVFAARPYGPDGEPVGGESAGEESVRTGDLGFLYEGELFVTGRVKDLVIVGGQNYYPQDAEELVTSAHPAFTAQRAAAWSPDDLDGPGGPARGRGIAVAVETAERDQRVLADALRAAAVAVARAVPAPVTVYAVARNKLPRTTSGKIRRQTSGQDLGEGRIPVLAQWSGLR